MRVRLNKAYLIIGLTAIFVLAAMLSGPLIRNRARQKVKPAAPVVAPLEQNNRAPQPEQKTAPTAPPQASN